MAWRAIWPHYSASWGEYNPRHLVSTSFEMNLTRHIGMYKEWLLQEVHLLNCQPAWADYTIDVRYRDGLRSISHSTTAGKTIQDTLISGVYPNVITGDTSNWSVSWSDDDIRNLKCMNHYALLDTIVHPLAGTYDQVPIPGDGPNITSNINSTQHSFYPINPSFSYFNSLKEELYSVQMGSGTSMDIRKYHHILPPTHS